MTATLTSGFSDIFGSQRGVTPGMAHLQTSSLYDAIEGLTIGVMTDKFYQENTWTYLEKQKPLSSALADLKIIASTSVIWDPNSTNQKVYQGHVAMNEAGQFVALFTYGGSSTPYQGKKRNAVRSVAEACEILHTQMNKKLNGRSSSSSYTSKGKTYEKMNAGDVAINFRQSALALNSPSA